MKARPHRPKAIACLLRLKGYKATHCEDGAVELRLDEPWLNEFFTVDNLLFEAGYSVQSVAYPSDSGHTVLVMILECPPEKVHAVMCLLRLGGFKADASGRLLSAQGNDASSLVSLLKNAGYDFDYVQRLPNTVVILAIK